jgi:uncharacterized protein (DUF433 family)
MRLKMPNDPLNEVKKQFFDVIVQEFFSGVKLNDIAKEYSLSQQEIYHLAKYHRTDIDNSGIIELYKSGKTIQQVAAAFGLSYEAVRRRLRKEGVHIRNPKETKAVKEAQGYVTRKRNRNTSKNREGL